MQTSDRIADGKERPTRVAISILDVQSVLSMS
jgi:hypothetical protein